MQAHAKLAENSLRLWKNVVEEEYEHVLDLHAGLAQRIAEIHFAAAVRGHVLDQKHAPALDNMALDLRVAAECFGLLAHVEHRQAQSLRHPRRERDAGGLAAGNGVERIGADRAL